MNRRICDDCARYMCALVDEETGEKCNCECHKKIRGYTKNEDS